MNFRTQYDRQRIQCRSGNSVINSYVARYDDDGHLIAEVSEKHDIYPEIQAYRQSTDINYLVSRFAAGDDTALSKVQGLYGDFTEMPKTYAEALNAMNKADDLFAKLPADVKAKFDNSLSVFLSKSGTQEWFDNLGFMPAAEPAVEPAVEPVKE
ncbi:MAG: internal scaffolding protein [Microviridae sp.]|nr:MAG: internal scaffolding protein [Microviridae sp.]AXQ65904.1 MAG: internal scaffolding protein [Microviridae sp.]